MFVRRPAHVNRIATIAVEDRFLLFLGFPSLSDVLHNPLLEVERRPNLFLNLGITQKISGVKCGKMSRREHHRLI
jgi:hypothetical protein